ncbi:MAG: ribosome recycling factor [Firmicutes bacterium]|nr:ribosome recycling factor [Bacillota bacterium]MCL1953248.1 ribosome recycling factor [Bacillota bacterium]
MEENVEVKRSIDNFNAKMQKAIDFFVAELQNIRAGRVSANLLNKIVVDYYGTPTPIPQMANVSIPDARTMLVSVWDTSAIKAVSKAILQSDLGLNPSDDGKVIRLSFPQLTQEKRKELAKSIKKISDDSKVVLRNERRDVIDAFKKYEKDNIITKDDLESLEKDIQKMLDKNIELLDKLTKDKEKELMEI